MLLLVTTLSLTFTSCGGDDDEPNGPGNTSSGVVSGSVSQGEIVFITSDCIPGFFWNHERNGTDGGAYICLINDLPPYSYLRIAYAGSVSKLSDIKSAPSSGWSTAVPLENGGYVITYTYSGKPYYIRLLVALNYSVSGDLVGINYQFQHFTPSNI